MTTNPTDLDDSPALLHIATAGNVLGLTVAQVRSLCDEGRLHREVIARKTYIPAASLRSYIESLGQSA